MGDEKLIYKYPRIKFADTNTAEQQLEHIRSEVVEAIQAYNAGLLGDMDIELHDIGQSVETLQRMREERAGVSTEEGKVDMIQKNYIRGYYN